MVVSQTGRPRRKGPQTRVVRRVWYRAAAVTELEIHHLLLLACFAIAGVTFFVTGVVTAPYGRHSRGGFGPMIPKRIGWALMETPSLVVFAAIFFSGRHSNELVPRVFATLWLLHYFQRAWIDPFWMGGGKSKPMPLSVPLAAIAFNLLNSYLNARWISELAPGWSTSWLYDPRFLYGLMLFVGGAAVNRWADAVLFKLRRQSTEYSIPRGGLFDDISCPNYFGELVQWFGWAILTWSGAGLSFAVFTAANLIPRAVAHHRWYQRQFADYPRRRAAIFPRVL